MKSRENRRKKQKFKLENIARGRLRKRWKFELDCIARGSCPPRRAGAKGSETFAGQPIFVESSPDSTASAPELSLLFPRGYFSSAGVAVAGPSPTISRTASESFAPS